MVAPPAGTGSAGLLTYWTASSTVSSSLSLFWDNPNIRLGIGTSQPSSTVHIIAGTTGATTLQLMGLAGQTGNLFSVASSNGARFFEITSAGIASSTYFIAVNASTSRLDVSGSSTLKDFTFTSASSTGNLTIGGTFQSNAGQTTLASVSSTNLFANGYLTVTGNGLFSGSTISIAPSATSTSLLYLQGATVSSTTLNIQGVTSQSAPLLTISSSTGIPLFNINAIGQIGIATSTYPASSTLLTIASSSQIFNISSGGNVMIGTSTSPNAALLTIATTSNIFTVLSNGRIGIGTSTPGSALDVKGTLRLSGSASGYVGFAPAASAGATTYTLPSADGSSGQVLTTDGSGILSWTTKVEGTSQDFKGLSLRTSPDTVASTTVVLDHADEIVMDTGNRVATWDDLSAVITTAGAGGLDTGSEAASTWYEIYAIRKSSDGTKNLLLHRAKDYFLDESQTTVDGSSEEIRKANRTAVAQTFTVDTTGLVEFVDVNLKEIGTVGSGRIWAEIRATSAGAPTGAALATSDKLDVTGIDGTTFRWLRFVFRSPQTLTASTTYALVLTGDWTQDAANTTSWQKGGSVYANGNAYGLDSGTWTAIGGSVDHAFKIYVTRNDTSVNMPSGYDQKAKVGYVYNDSGSNFMPFTAIGKKVTSLQTNNLGGISATIPTLTDAASTIPPIPVVIYIIPGGTGTAGDNMYMGGVPDGYYIDALRVNGGLRTSYGTSQVGNSYPPVDIVTEYQAVYLQVSANSSNFYRSGYTWGSSGGADVAEEYLVDDESISPGDIVSLTDYGRNYVDRAMASSSFPILGIISTKPGIVLKDWSYTPQNTRNVALTGRVPVKFSNENGEIKVGDRLTLSKTIPGYTMKQNAAGQSIGIALESSENKKDDKILTFINLSYWIPTISSPADAAENTSSSVSSSTPSSSPLDNLMGYIIKKFRDFFDIVFDKGLLKVAKVVADNITANLGSFNQIDVQGEATLHKGVSTYDRATGEPYCIGVQNGQILTIPGNCENQDFESSSSTQEIAPQATSTSESTLTNEPSSILGSTPTSTTEETSSTL